MPKPRVLILTIPSLGFATYAENIKALEGIDDVEVATVTMRASVAQRILTRRYPGEPGWLSSSFRRRQLWRLHLPWLLRRLREGGYDAMHGASQIAGPLLQSAHRRTGIPYSLGMDTTVALNAGPKPWPAGFERLDRIDRAAIGESKFVAAWSHWAARSIEAHYAARAIVTPPGLNVGVCVVRQASRSGPTRILFIGNDWRRKGGDRLVSWHQEHLRDTELHLVGRDVPNLGALSNVVTHGQVPRSHLVREILPSCDILALPTREDMSPYVLAEAAAAGVPSVASRIAGIPELVENHVTGVTCDPHDDRGFVEALRSLADSPATVDRYGQQARAFAVASLDARESYRPIVDGLLG